MENKTLKQRNALKGSFKTIFDASIYLILFEIIFKGFILVLFKPIRALIVYLFVRAKTYDEVIHQQIPGVLVWAGAIVLSILAVILFIALVYYECTVILKILNKSRNKEEIDLLSITKSSLIKVKTMFIKKRIGLAIYLLMLIPVLNIGIQLSVFPVLSIPNFLNFTMDKFPGSRIILTISAVSLIYLFIKLFIVLPILTFSDKSFKEASKLSFQKIKGKSFKIISLITIGILIVLTISRLPYLISGDLKFRLPRSLKSFSNSAVTIFTIFITPLILSLSLEIFNLYEEFRFLNKKENELKGGSGKLAKPIEKLISNLERYKGALIVLTLALIIALNIQAQQGLRPLKDKQRVIGHRGGDYGVENTIDTIVFAGEEGSDYVEIDVLLTKDNVPVVIHDNNLKRLAETTKKISDLEINEVETIAIESESKTENKKDQIPTLEELSKAVKGKTKLLLEFKLHGKEKENLVDKTIEILEEEGILEDTIFQTAEYEIIKEFNEKYDKLYIGYIYKSKKKSVPIKRALNTPVDFISAEGSKIDKKMIKQVHKAKKPIYAWTINEVSEAEKLLNMGVDGIITDIPLEMIELVDRYNK